MREAHTSKDAISEMSSQIEGVLEERWFVSDEGSDENNCQTESSPCNNLQTILDRASDKANIYSTSDTLSLDLVNDTVWYKMATWRTFTLTGSCCLINSSLSYALRSINSMKTHILCSSKYCLQQLFFTLNHI